MNQKSRKKVTIDVEFNSFTELQFILNKVLGMAKQHQHSERQNIAGAVYEYTFEIMNDESDFREEIINGQRCLVIKSKL